jgi:hypothetical protein
MQVFKVWALVLSLFASGFDSSSNFDAKLERLSFFLLHATGGGAVFLLETRVVIYGVKSTIGL